MSIYNIYVQYISTLQSRLWTVAGREIARTHFFFYNDYCFDPTTSRYYNEHYCCHFDLIHAQFNFLLFHITIALTTPVQSLVQVQLYRSRRTTVREHRHNQVFRSADRLSVENNIINTTTQLENVKKKEKEKRKAMVNSEHAAAYYIIIQLGRFKGFASRPPLAP